MRHTPQVHDLPGTGFYRDKVSLGGADPERHARPAAGALRLTLRRFWPWCHRLCQPSSNTHTLGLYGSC